MPEVWIDSASIWISLAQLRIATTNVNSITYLILSSSSFLRATAISTEEAPVTASKMAPQTLLLRRATIVFRSLQSLNPSTSACGASTARCLSQMTLASRIVCRPTIGEASRAVEGTKAVMVNSILEQVRGMKVRSSVKKLCEGCKVRLTASLFNRCGGW